MEEARHKTEKEGTISQKYNELWVKPQTKKHKIIYWLYFVVKYMTPDSNKGFE